MMNLGINYQNWYQTDQKSMARERKLRGALPDAHINKAKTRQLLLYGEEKEGILCLCKNSRIGTEKQSEV